LRFGVRVEEGQARAGMELILLGFGVRVAGVWIRISGFGFQDSGFGLRVSGFWFRISGFVFQDSGFGVGRVSEPNLSRLRVLSFGFRISFLVFVLRGGHLFRVNAATGTEVGEFERLP